MGETTDSSTEPVPFFLDDSRPPANKIALCLSGGGYRAMLFHAGAIWRLNELGLLPEIAFVSSVSGGSIAAAALAVAWDSLQWTKPGPTGLRTATNLRQAFLEPVLKQSQAAIDFKSAALGLLPWDSAFRHVAESYKGNITRSEEQVLLLKAGYAHAEANIRVWYAPNAGLPTEPGTTPPSP